MVRRVLQREEHGNLEVCGRFSLAGETLAGGARLDSGLDD
jgi:hypothetical protein